MFFHKKQTTVLVQWQSAEHMAVPDQSFQREAEEPAERLPGQKSETAVSEFNDEFVPGTVCELAQTVVCSSQRVWSVIAQNLDDLFILFIC